MLANVFHLVIFLLLIRSINLNTVRVIFQVSHQLSMQWVIKNCTPCGVSFQSYFSPCKLSFSYIQLWMTCFVKLVIILFHAEMVRNKEYPPFIKVVKSTDDKITMKVMMYMELLITWWISICMSNLKESGMINSCAKKKKKFVKICQQLGRGLRLKNAYRKRGWNSARHFKPRR